MMMNIPHDQQKLYETSRNLPKKYVLDCMYSPFTKISPILSFPAASLEQFLKAIQGAVSQAPVLILPQRKLNRQSSYCGFFFKYAYIGFPGGSEVKASARNAGDPDSIPGSGRSPGEGSGNPLQYSCLENSTDGGAWWAIVHGVAKSWTRLSDLHFHFHLHRSVKQFTQRRICY